MNRNLQISLLTGFFLLIAVTCVDNEDCVEPGEIIEEVAQNLIQVTVDFALAEQISSVPHEDVTISDGIITGDTLELVFNYTGGCEEHDFGLVTSGALLATNPPQAEFYLLHDRRSDIGKGNVKRIQFFDLVPFKEYYQGWGDSTAGTVIIRVEGYYVNMWADSSMWYIF
jgi:hypothetical protein